MALVIVKGDDVHYAAGVTRPTGSANTYDSDGFFTPYGFIIPIHTQGLNLIDFFETGKLPYTRIISTPFALVVDHKGQVFDYSVAQGVLRQRIPIGPKTLHVRSLSPEAEEMARSAIKLMDKFDIRTVKEIVRYECEFDSNVMEVRSIDAIAAELTKRGFTIPMPHYICEIQQVRTPEYKELLESALKDLAGKDNV